MAQVYVPWTRQHPECWDALAGRDVVSAQLQSDEHAYWRLVRYLWGKGDPFTLVEHDVVVLPDTLDELDNCPHPWCAFKVTTGEGWAATLGCVRFTPVGEWPVPEPTRWQDLDWTLEAALVKAGWSKHLHSPILDHVNPGVIWVRSLQPA